MCIRDRDVIGEVQAGNTFKAGIKPMQALRIFTGAAVPPSADTVVIQENVQREDNVCLLYTSPSPRDRTRSRMPSSA